MLLLDFEVARRLFRHDAEIVHELDDLPVGVAIARILRLLQEDTTMTFNAFLSSGKFYIFGGKPDTRRKNINTILQESKVEIGIVPKFLEVSSNVRKELGCFVISI
jgi:hypothetical protein